MGRPPIPSPNRQQQSKVYPNVILVDSGIVAQLNELEFLDGSIIYFDYKLTQSFQFSLFDNRGPGDVRIVYNRPGMDLATPQNGAKTLSAGESLYIDEDIWHVSIYYITASLVEMILKSKVDTVGSF